MCACVAMRPSQSRSSPSGPIDPWYTDRAECSTRGNLPLAHGSSWQSKGTNGRRCELPSLWRRQSRGRNGVPAVRATAVRGVAGSPLGGRTEIIPPVARTTVVPRPRLVAPHDLDLGAVRGTATVRGKIRVANNGAALLTGTVRIAPNVPVAPHGEHWRGVLRRRRCRDRRSAGEYRGHRSRAPTVVRSCLPLTAARPRCASQSQWSGSRSRRLLWR